MDDILGTILGKIVMATAIAIGIGIAMSRQRAKNRKLAPAIEPLLRERGPLTLPELAGALGRGGFFARGQVALALDELVIAGRVEVMPAPDGTPQLEKVNHIRYRWRDA